MSADAGLGIIIAGAVGAFGQGAGMRPQRSIGKIIAQITVEEKHHDEIEITDHPVEQGAAITDHAFKKPAEVVIRCAWSNSPGAPRSLLGGISGALTNALTGQVTNLITGAAAKQIGGSALGNLAVANLGQLISSPLVSFGAQINSGTGRGTTRVQDVYQSLLDLQTSVVPVDVYTGKRRYTNMLLKSITVETDKTTENSLVCLIALRQIIIVQTSVIAVTAAPVDQAQPQQTAAPLDAGTKQPSPVQPDDNGQLARSIGDLGGQLGSSEVTTVNTPGFTFDD